MKISKKNISRIDLYNKKNPVEIVCYKNGWIYEAIAEDFFKQIKDKYPNRDIRITKYPTLREKVIYIHLWFMVAIEPIRNSRNIYYVSHLDKLKKIIKIIKLAKLNSEFLCMSQETAEYLSNIIRNKKIYAVSPKSFHFKNKKSNNKKITFGLFTRIYKDKRKKDKLIRKFIDIINSSSNKNAELIIYGEGFENIIKNQSKNIIYDKTKFNKNTYIKYHNKCDYVVYFGQDEGAYSILDAAANGKKVISTNQGFHKDINLSIGSHLVNNPIKIIEIIGSLIQDHKKNNKIITLEDCIEDKNINQKIIKDFKIKQIFRALTSPRDKSFIGYGIWILAFILFKFKYKTLNIIKKISFW